MKLNKIFSLMTSSMITLLSVTSLTANASVARPVYEKSPEYIETFSNYTKLDEKYYPMYEHLTKCQLISKEQLVGIYIGNSGKTLLYCTTQPDYFAFDIKTDFDITKAEKNEIESFKKELTSKIQKDLDVSVSFNICVNPASPMVQCVLDDIENYSAKSISAYLKQDGRFYNFLSTEGSVYINDFPMESPLTYGMSEKEITEIAEKYCPGADIIKDSSTNNFWSIKLSDDASVTDYLDISLKIYNDLGIVHNYHNLEQLPGSINFMNVDIENYVDGDANCDGKLTIADSTAILQSLGNADKYGLSPQGEFNADICNVGDGVTAMDALEVQIALASNK